MLLSQNSFSSAANESQLSSEAHCVSAPATRASSQNLTDCSQPQFRDGPAGIHGAAGKSQTYHSHQLAELATSSE